jgi:carboxylesterase type B
MAFIHGGGFVDGASESFQPDLFINNEVILVTINYRIGAFGRWFLFKPVPLL